MRAQGIEQRGSSKAVTMLASVKVNGRNGGGGGGGAGGGAGRTEDFGGGGGERSLVRYVFNDVEQCSTTALFTARADGRSESLPPLDFCKACLWQVMDASIDLRDPNPN